MQILKYIFIDLIGLITFFVLNLFLNPSKIDSNLITYIEIASLCFIIGILFTNGRFHGLSLGIIIPIVVLGILYLIGRPAAMPISELINREFITPFLPVPLLGLLAGFAGEKLKALLIRRKS